MAAPVPTKRSYRVQHCSTKEEFDRAVAIRIAVFVDEQKFSMEDELDDKDETSDHILLIAQNEDGTEEDAGTIRWWPKPNVHPPAGKLGRLAVHKHCRGGGSGKLLITAMEEHVKQRRGKAGVALKGEKSVKVICHSQTHAQKFYEKSGYVAEGDVFIEDGGPHILLTKVLELNRETASRDMAMQLCNRRATQMTANILRQVARPSTSVRHAHSDIQVPSFDYYRRKERLDPSKSYRDAPDATAPYSYLAPIGLAVTSAYMAKYIVRDIVSFVGPARDVMSLAKVEISLAAVPEGKNAVFEWRNKPIFVRHRTPEEIAREEGVNVSQLRHPENDSQRVKKPEWLIVVGICTHLGCIPIANAGDFGGYYCPCHGSHYDASGRVRKGPAPLNLEVPQYVFKDDSTVVIG